MSVNLNDLAKSVTLKEGKKLSLSIAQVKEVLKIILELLAKMTYGEVSELFKKTKSKK